MMLKSSFHGLATGALDSYTRDLAKHCEELTKVILRQEADIRSLKEEVDAVREEIHLPVKYREAAILK